jgi:hypothetical protein
VWLTDIALIVCGCCRCFVSLNTQFDHLEFPGVVPRSFLGPLLLAGPAALLKPLFVWLGLSKDVMIIVVRLVLGMLFAASFAFLRRAFAKRFAVARGADNEAERRLRNFIALASCCQFHLLFYSSRPLANTLASLCVNVAFGFWLRSSGGPVSASSDAHQFTAGGRERDGGWMVAWLAVACIVFRCDMVLLSGCLILFSLVFYQWLDIHRLLQFGCAASVLAVCATVLVDSVYWRRRWMWPELEVALFNAPQRDAQGQLHSKAEQWGTEPFGWYFTRALPKALMGGLVLLPFALMQRVPRSLAWSQLVASVRLVDPLFSRLLVPSLLFVLLYSFMPHKELRFIYPLLPLLACFVGLGMWKIDETRRQLREKQRQDEDEDEDDDGDAQRQGSKTASRSSNIRRPHHPRSSGSLPFFSLVNLLWRGAQLALLASLAVSALSLYVSSLNYPGGHALHRFHALVREHKLLPIPSLHASISNSGSSNGVNGTDVRPTVHLCNLAAMTGATRFGQLFDDAGNDTAGGMRLRYSKQEGLSNAQLVAAGFDFLIVEANADDGGWPAELAQHYKPIGGGRGGAENEGSSSNIPLDLHSPALIYAFDRLRMPSRAHPSAVVVRPALWLLQRI